MPSCQVPQSRQSKSGFCYVHSKNIPTNKNITKDMNVLPSALMHAQASAQSKNCTPQESRLPGLAPQKFGPPHTEHKLHCPRISKRRQPRRASHCTLQHMPPLLKANAKFEIGNAAGGPELHCHHGPHGLEMRAVITRALMGTENEDPERSRNSKSVATESGAECGCQPII